MAHHDFEAMNKITILEDVLDLEFLQPIIDDGVKFWTSNVFPALMDTRK